MRAIPLLAVLALIGCSMPDGNETGQMVQSSPQVYRPAEGVDEVTVYFNFDDSRLLRQEAEKLDERVGCYLQYEDFPIRIDGHTDVQGSPSYNYVLGERRATEIAAYLIARGIDADRITVTSYGEQDPDDLRNTEEAHARNRRGITLLECGSGTGVDCEPVRLDQLRIQAFQPFPDADALAFGGRNLEFDRDGDIGGLRDEVEREVGEMENFEVSENRQGRQSETFLMEDGANELVQLPIRRLAGSESVSVELVSTPTGRLENQLIFRSANLCRAGRQV